MTASPALGYPAPMPDERLGDLATGGYARVAAERLEAKALEIYEAVSAAA